MTGVSFYTMLSSLCVYACEPRWTLGSHKRRKRWEDVRKAGKTLGVPSHLDSKIDLLPAGKHVRPALQTSSFTSKAARLTAKLLRKCFNDKHLVSSSSLFTLAEVLTSVASCCVQPFWFATLALVVFHTNIGRDSAVAMKIVPMIVRAILGSPKPELQISKNEAYPACTLGVSRICATFSLRWHTYKPVLHAAHIQ